MSNQTKVKQMQLRTRGIQADKIEQTLTRPLELPPKDNRWAIRFVQADQLVRNFAIVGVLLLTVMALKSSSAPQAQSVFSALQNSAGLEWDESVGKLSFVNSILPESIQAVWSSQDDVEVYAPAMGETVHAWSRKEPYIEIRSDMTDVYSAGNGEVMSIAHGLNEERIIRIRHEDNTEAIYGNLKSCYVNEGDRVCAGDVIAELLDDHNLVFELRVAGRSVDPQGKMLPLE